MKSNFLIYFFCQLLIVEGNLKFKHTSTILNHSFGYRKMYFLHDHPAAHIRRQKINWNSPGDRQHFGRQTNLELNCLGPGEHIGWHFIRCSWWSPGCTYSLTFVSLLFDLAQLRHFRRQIHFERIWLGLGKTFVDNIFGVFYSWVRF